MNLFYKSFPISSKKFAEVYISSNDEIVIRLVTLSSGDKDRKSVLISTGSLEKLINLKSNILQYLQSPVETPTLDVHLSSSENGEIRLTTSSYIDQSYMSIRYYHKEEEPNSEKTRKPTRFGIILNICETLQLFMEIPKIVSYISYLTKYEKTGQIALKSIQNDVFPLAMKMFKKFGEGTAYCTDLENCLNTYYNEMTSQLNMNHIVESYLDICNQTNLTPLNQIDLIDLINILIKEEKKNIVNFCVQSYTSEILQDMLLSTSTIDADVLNK